MSHSSCQFLEKASSIHPKCSQNLHSNGHQYTQARKVSILFQSQHTSCQVGHGPWELQTCSQAWNVYKLGKKWEDLAAKLGLSTDVSPVPSTDVCPPLSHSVSPALSAMLMWFILYCILLLSLCLFLFCFSWLGVACFGFLHSRNTNNIIIMIIITIIIGCRVEWSGVEWMESLSGSRLHPCRRFPTIPESQDTTCVSQGDVSSATCPVCSFGHWQSRGPLEYMVLLSTIARALPLECWCL